jgi:hypothetical protein
LHEKSAIPPPSRTNNTEAYITTADVITLLLYTHAAIGEVALWAKASGSSETHENAVTALQTLDANASAITTGILKLRQ